MGIPIVVLCRRHLIDTVAAIGTIAGFNTDVTIHADEPLGEPVKVYSCTLTGFTIEELTEGFEQGHDVSQWNWTLVVDVFKPESVTDIDTDEMKLYVYADIRKKVLEDRHRGIYAQDTHVTGVGDRADGNEGIEVTGFCKIRTLMGLPDQL